MIKLPGISFIAPIKKKKKTMHLTGIYQEVMTTFPFGQYEFEFAFAENSEVRHVIHGISYSNYCFNLYF